VTAAAAARPTPEQATGSPGPPIVRVVVVTYSPGDSLAAFLDSLETATRAPIEVVLADNGSTDNAPQRAAEQRLAVTLLPTGGNLGYGRAANAGAAGAEAEWLVVANPDIVWSPGSLDTLLTVATRWPGGAAFGPAIRTPAGELYPSARAFPSLGRGIGHALCGWWWPANPWTAAYRRERGAPQEGPTGWLSGSCLLLRRSAFEAVDGFDPTYFMYFEDLDLCRRLAAAGWQNVHVPSAVVTHVGAHATSRDAVRMLAAHHRSAYRYLSRQYPGGRHAPLRLLLAVGLAVRYLLARRVRRVADGAAPTRSAAVLQVGPDVGRSAAGQPAARD